MSWAIWITGRPGSGKSTLARQVAAALERRGERVAILEASAFAAETVPGVRHQPMSGTSCTALSSAPRAS